MFKRKITCIRHGHPDYNGMADPNLSSDGINQAKLIPNEQFDLIVLSPLRRVIETYTNSGISSQNVMINDL